MKKSISKVEQFITEFKTSMISYGEAIIKVKGN
jgi:hypothetical protein